MGEVRTRGAIKRRLTELWDYPRHSLPRKVGGWYYFETNSGLQNQSVLVRCQELGAKPEVILDPNTWSEDGTVALSGFSPEETGEFMAYTVSAHGSDRQEIRILNLTTGQHLPEVIKYCRFTNMAWHNTKGFYYGRYPKPGTVAPEDENNFNQIYWHQLGTDQAQDVLVYERPDRKELGFFSRPSPRIKTTLRSMFLTAPIGAAVLLPPAAERWALHRAFAARGKQGTIFLGSVGNNFYFFTDLNAPKGRLVCIDIERPNRKNWREIVAEQEDVILTARLINGHFVVAFMHNAHSLVKLYDLQGEKSQELALPTLGSVQEISGRQNHAEFFFWILPRFYTPPR